MATYKELKGLSLQTVAGDPSNLTAGQIWYNSSAKKIKVFKAGAGNWATGGNTNTRHSYGAGFGTQTAAVSAGGYSPPRTADSEEYDGSTWTEGSNLNQARSSMRGCGTETAGLVAGGYKAPVSADSEEYNGSSWTEGSNLNTARYNTSTGGIQTAGINVGGYIPGSNDSALVEEYDGTSWSEVNNVPSARYGICLIGTQVALMSHSENTEVLDYDGTNWTDGTNTPASIDTGGHCGTNTAGFVWAGAAAQTWNGTAWTSVNAQSIARKENQAATAGTTTSTMMSGGELPSGSPNLSLSTEEWDDPSLVTATFTSS